MDYQKLFQLFKERYGVSPRIFRSPGRINILGEHVDYNDGFVLPAGIDREILFVCAPSHSTNSDLVSMDENEEVSFQHDQLKAISNHWAKYVLGCVDQLQKLGHNIKPFNAMITGNVPIGAGLSSSAALECVTLFALTKLNDIQLSKKEIALLAQKAENDFVGVNCGIMDQFASVFAKKDHVIKLDCRTLEYDLHPLDEGTHQLILVNSMVKHSLGDSEYNTRRKECEAGVRALADAGYPVKSLRDADLKMLNSVKEHIPANVLDRCTYIIEEIERAEMASEAMDQGEMERLGELMYETHSGLQHKYKVSCDELDFLVDYTRPKDYVSGARVMGGGFGGCTINLVKNESADQFCSEISSAYKEKYGISPSVYKVNTNDGTSEVNFNSVNHEDRNSTP